MGLVELSNKNLINKALVKTFYKLSHKVIFISKSEYDEACKNFSYFKNKFIYVPFCIDHKYWKLENSKIKNKELLFIGNDSNRDFDFLVKLAKQMLDFNFTIVTERLQYADSPNIKLINGNWNKKILEDDEIKKFYNESFLTLVPIKNSFQPSGQSVTLQSLSMKTPVLITKTKGFWDVENFTNNENIFFCSENNADEWANKVRDIYKNYDDYLKVSENGQKLIEQKFNLDYMYKNILDLLR